jgi:hypothetical protein
MFKAVAATKVAPAKVKYEFFISFPSLFFIEEQIVSRGPFPFDSETTRF